MRLRLRLRFYKYRRAALTVEGRGDRQEPEEALRESWDLLLLLFLDDVKVGALAVGKEPLGLLVRVLRGGPARLEPAQKEVEREREGHRDEHRPRGRERLLEDARVVEGVNRLEKG